MGPHALGVAQPHPDPVDPDTMIAGVRKRNATKIPDANPILIADLRSFVRKWVRRHLTPLSPTSDTSVETWLKSTNYPKWRKDELLSVWQSRKGDAFAKIVRKVKAFQKDEVYAEYKHARGIYSRTDTFKCFIGPIAKLIEKEVFKNKFFIKNVPVSQRSHVIMEDVYKAGHKYAATDYTGFESLFVKTLMEACEFELYDYMTSLLSEHFWFMRVCDEVIGGENVCHFRDFIVRILATRMSGEMVTSLGNGFSNLMFMLFACEINRNKNVAGKVEGDDGIFSMDGEFPSAELFEQLGLKIKLVVHDSICKASFCGMVFDPEERINLTDPRHVLATFAWTSRQYLSASSNKLKLLLRCKALSIAHQYPGCPIIAALAQYGLRVTKSFDVKGFIETRSFSKYAGEYYRQIVADAVKDEKNIRIVSPGIKTRLLVEELYGISVESQLKLEEELMTKNDLEPIRAQDYIFNFHPDWLQYYYAYSMRVNTHSKDVRFPAGVWSKAQGFIKDW
jgi:hypothetical protein